MKCPLNSVNNNHSDDERRKNVQRCHNCGRKAHEENEVCPARGKNCTKCNKPNHFANVCRAKLEENSDKITETMLKNNKGPRKQNKCNGCGQKAHEVNEICLAKGKHCGKCGKANHLMNVCPLNSVNNNREKCKGCGRSAHKNNEECLAKGKTCTRCKQQDHFSSMCRTQISDDNECILI